MADNASKSDGRVTARTSPAKYSVFSDIDEVLRRVNLGVGEALCDHKLYGNAVAMWRDDRVVIVPPEEIQITVPAER